MRDSTILDDFKYYVLRSRNTMNHLIAINVAVFLVFGILWVVLSLFTINPSLYNFLSDLLYFPSSPLKFLYKPWTIITYQFMHASPMHILFNMLMFVFAGRIFREYLGDKKLLSVYLLGGVAGAVLFMAAYQIFPYFRADRDGAVLLGASASIIAILTAIGTLLPRYTVFLILIGPVQLVYIVLFLIIVDFLSIVGYNPGGSIAHLGGALWGFAYIRMLQRGTDMGAWLTNLLDRIKRIGKKEVIRPRVHYYNEKPAPAPRNPKISRITQEEVDSILDKIAQSGYDSLTQREKDVLFRASKES